MSMIVSRAVAANRRARAMLVLEYIEQAVRLGMPVPEMLRASALAERWPIRKRLERLAAAVEGGAPLSEAMRLNVPEMPRRAVGMVGAGSRTNSLVPTLARLVAQEREHLGRDVFRGVFQRIYLLLTLLLVCGGIMMLAVFVLPKFEQICKDFRVELPWESRAIRLAAQTIVIPAFVVLALLAFWLYADAWHEIFDPRQRRRSEILRGAIDRARWFVPIFSQPIRDQGYADVCHTLAAALDAGMPVETAILEASALQLNPVLRNRLIRWSQLLSRGMDLAVAARAVRLPNLMVGLLAPSVASATLADLFRFLGRFYTNRAARGAAWMRAASIPLTAILAGAIVLLLIVAIFKPMLLMIERVAPYTRVP